MYGTCILVVVILATAQAFAQADLSVTSVNQTCDPCKPGQRATIVNTVTNNGPQSDSMVQLQLATPALSTEVVPESWTTSAGQFQTDPQGNVVGLDIFGPTYVLGVDVGAMRAGSTCTVTYQVDLDMEPPPAFELLLNAPPDLWGPVWPVGMPSADATGNAWTSQPPWWEWNVTVGLSWPRVCARGGAQDQLASRVREQHPDPAREIVLVRPDSVVVVPCEPLGLEAPWLVR